MPNAEQIFAVSAAIGYVLSLWAMFNAATQRLGIGLGVWKFIGDALTGNLYWALAIIGIPFALLLIFSIIPQTRRFTEGLLEFIFAPIEKIGGNRGSVIVLIILNLILLWATGLNLVNGLATFNPWLIVPGLGFFPLIWVTSIYVR